MKINKSLSIMKYNKKLQKRLNISINDYKECSKIEIELKLVDNKYDKFINISDKEKDYCHIYFNNSKEEIKRNYRKVIIFFVVNKMVKLYYDGANLQKSFKTCK